MRLEGEGRESGGDGRGEQRKAMAVAQRAREIDSISG